MYRFEADLSNCPDLGPILFALAAVCPGQSVIHNIQRLRIKESDRLLSVKTQQTQGDHRMAMALLAADMKCDDVECVRKSYPGFYEQLCQLRG